MKYVKDTIISFAHEIDNKIFVVQAKIESNKVFKVVKKKSGKLINDLKSTHQDALEKTLCNLNQNIGILNSNVIKIRDDNTAIKNFILDLESESSNRSPGVKRKATESLNDSIVETDVHISETILNNKLFKNRLRNEIEKRFGEDPGQTLSFYEKKYPKDMDEIKKDLLKLVPQNSTFKESWRKACDCFKNDRNKKTQ